MFVICLIISYKYTNNLPISQLFLCFSYPELTLVYQIMIGDCLRIFIESGCS